MSSKTLLFVLLIVLTILWILPSNALAQVGGTGADVLRPVERLWQLMRNISYLALTIAFLVIGLMIMFRQRINAQTVVSVQQALPGVVIALVLITFSYFIASLIIDLGFILAQAFGIAIVGTLGTLPPGRTAADIIRDILNSNTIFNFFTDFFRQGGSQPGLSALQEASGTIGDTIAPIFDMPIVSIGPIDVSTRWILAGLLGLIFSQVSPAAGIGSAIVSLASPNTAAALLVFVVLFLSLLAAMFRLFLSLVGAYVAIILNTIFGPFLILFSAIPGRGNLFEQWLRGLLANVLIFPVVFGLFAMVAAILGITTPWQLTGSVGRFFQPLPLFAGLPDQFIRFILAYGIVLASPGIPDFIRAVIGTPQPQQLTQAVTQATGTGTGAVGGLLGRLFRR